MRVLAISKSLAFMLKKVIHAQTEIEMRSPVTILSNLHSAVHVLVMLVLPHVAEAILFCSDKDVPDWPCTSPPELQSKPSLKDEEEKDVTVKMDIDVRSCCPSIGCDFPGLFRHPNAYEISADIAIYRNYTFMTSSLNGS